MYGGTKEEMKRLIQDASQLTDVQEELGITVDESSMSFGNIVNAISVMQSKMDIAGTTTKEASTTITGSINSMKSAWQNFLTGLGDENANMEDLTNKLTESIQTVAKNLAPVIERVVKNMVNVANDLINDFLGEGTVNFNGEQFIQGLKEALTKVIEVLKWFIDNKELVIGAISAITGAFIVTKIINFVLAIKNLVVFLKGIPAVVGLVTKGFALLKTALTFLTGPVGIIIGVITALVGAFMYLWNTNEGFRNAVINIWNNIKEVASNVFNAIANFFTVTVPNAIQNLYNSIVNFFTVEIPNAFNNFVKFVSSMVENVITFFKELPYNIGLIIGNIIGNIIKFGQNLYNFATTTIPQVISTIIKFFSELPGKIWTWLVNTLERIGTWGINVWAKAKEIGGNVVNAIVNFFSQLPGKVWSWLINTISKFIIFGDNLITKARSAISNTVTAIINGFKSLPEKVANIGKNIVEGLWNGIKNAKDWVVGKVKNFAKGILDGMKSALGIHSPSTLFEKQVGKNIALGIGEGFTNEMQNVTNEMNSAIPTNFDTNANIIGSNISNNSMNYNYILNAFQEALGSMKIELNDEEAGKFVLKTVEDVIYT